MLRAALCGSTEMPSPETDWGKVMEYASSQGVEDLAAIGRDALMKGITSCIFHSSEDTEFEALEQLSRARDKFLVDGLTLRDLCEWYRLRFTDRGLADWNHLVRSAAKQGLLRFATAQQNVCLHVFCDKPESELEPEESHMLSDILNGKKGRAAWKYTTFADRTAIAKIINLFKK